MNVPRLGTRLALRAECSTFAAQTRPALPSLAAWQSRARTLDSTTSRRASSFAAPRPSESRSLSRSRWTVPASAALALGLFAHTRVLSTSAAVHLDGASGAGKTTSQSSAILREASPAAMRTPACQLVFMSVDEDRRDAWASWIGYFREAGFDCYDVNLALAGAEPAAAAGVQAFADELGAQIRLLSLQRRPVVFAQTTHAAHTALAQLQARDAQMSGLVLVLAEKEDAAQGDGVAAQARNLDTKRMRILVVDGADKDVLRNVERWMTDEGLA